MSGKPRHHTHPGDFDRGGGYVPSPNARRERIRRALDTRARRVLYLDRRRERGYRHREQVAA